jgi:hypothetical protein
MGDVKKTFKKFDGDDARRETEAAKRALQRSKNGRRWNATHR